MFAQYMFLLLLLLAHHLYSGIAYDFGACTKNILMWCILTMYINTHNMAIKPQASHSK